MNVHDLVFAGRRSDATALVHRDRVFTYAQLDRAAAVAADDLYDAGVRSGQVVPVLMPRGADLVAVLLGVLRLGAAYAVLDPNWPAARLDRLRAVLDAPVTESRDPFGRSPKGSAPRVDVSLDDRCAVFFTSGSTGEPKGVPCTHRALTELLRPGGMPFPMTAATVLTQAAALPWDAMAMELWGPLLAGGTCVLVDHLDPRALRHTIAARGQNTLWLTASLFNLFVDEDPGCFRGLHHVAIGGERLSPRHVRAFLERHPDIALYNGYGPVEGCVFATVHRVSEEDCSRPGGIPIGRVVRGTEVLVLDGDRMCEPGEPGEICLAGSRLSEGYLGDPELTAQRFPTIGRRRVYRTGDRGRCDADGTHHITGRFDRQVKVRGHRVEPAEIEQAALAHPAVTACTVVTRPGPDGPRLVAAYQSRVAPAELRGFLAERLPRHLMPDEVVPMAALPLLDTGKVDVAAVAAGVADPVLAEVLRLTAEVTGRAVAPADSLLEAGANSLLLLRLGMRVGKRFGAEIAPAAVFANPTAAGLAHLVHIGQTPRQARRRAEPRPWYRLTPAQYGFLVTERVDPANRLAWHCLLAWRIEGPVRTALLRDAVHTVHRRHQPLHARYWLDAVFPVAMVDPPTEPEFLVAPAADDASAQRILDELLTRPFDVDGGPVWRAVLVRQPTRALFGVAVHHVAFDGWSEHVLAAELSSVCLGRKPLRAKLSWPRPPAIAESSLPDQRSAVRAELAGVPPLVLPHVAGGIRPGRVVLDLDDAMVTTLTRYRTSTFVTGLAAFAAAVHAVTGQGDFPVAVPVVRRRHDAEHAIGCLLNVLCLRLRLPDHVDRAAAIAAAARSSEAGLATQDVPFTEALASLAARDDDPLARRFPAAMFVAQENRAPELAVPGCRTELVRPVPRWTGFELLVELWLAERRLSITHRPSIPADFAAALGKAMTDFLTCEPTP